MFQEDVIRAEISRGVFCGFPSCACAAEHPCRGRAEVRHPETCQLCVPLGCMAECTDPAFPFFPSRGRRGWLPAKRALKRRPCMQRALYVIGLSCVSAVSCCVAFDLQQRSSPGDVAHWSLCCCCFKGSLYYLFMWFSEVVPQEYVRGSSWFCFSFFKRLPSIRHPPCQSFLQKETFLASLVVSV